MQCKLLLRSTKCAFGRRTVISSNMDGLDTHLIDYSGIYHQCEAYYIMQKLQKNDFCSFSKYAWLFQFYLSCQKLCFRAQGKPINHHGAKTGISRVRLHSSVSLSNSWTNGITLKPPKKIKSLKKTERWKMIVITVKWDKWTHLQPVWGHSEMSQPVLISSLFCSL